MEEHEKRIRLLEEKGTTFMGTINQIEKNSRDNIKVVERKIQDLETKLKDVNKDFDDKVKRLQNVVNEKNDNEVRRLQNVVNDQNKILEKHQSFMEDIDKEKRVNDLIVLGLPENEEEDNLKFANILRKLDIDPEDVEVNKFIRLGKQVRGVSSGRKCRPLKVTLKNKSNRGQILKNAKKLNELEETDPLKKVFLKPDTHPEVRKEEKRLYEVFKTEKANRDNADIEVIYDRKRKVVTRNGEVVDRFRLYSHFH